MSAALTGSYYETKNDDGTCHYNGVLGDFNYNPNEFKLMKTNVKQSNGEITPVEILHYIGDETDGSKIKIPDGIETTFMMFSNTDIKSVPQIPSSVKNADAMFNNCKSLENAGMFFSTNIESASFMFSGCSNLKKGPLVIPGNVKNTSFMFSDCVNLRNTPRLTKGVEYADFMFANCESLQKPPKIPNTVKNSDCITVNCSGIDEFVAKNAEKEYQKNREKLIKKMNKPTLRDKMSSSFGALLQVHALHRMGYSIFKAPMVAYVMRQNGMMDKSFSGGMKALALAHGNGGLTSLLAMRSVELANKDRQKREEKNIRKLDNFDKINKNGLGNKKDYKSISKANIHFKSGYFNKFGNLSSNEKMAYQANFAGVSDYREEMFSKMLNNTNSRMSSRQVSEWYLSELSAGSVYYNESKNLIENNLTGKAKIDALTNLNEMTRLQMLPLIISARNLHDSHKIFHDGDFRKMFEMTEDMPIRLELNQFYNEARSYDDMEKSATLSKDEVLRRVSQMYNEDENTKCEYDFNF